MRDFYSDNRALGVGIMLFMAALILAALLFIMMNPVIDQVESTTLDQTDNQEAKDVINERTKIWGGVLFYVVLATMIFIVARANFESRGPG